MRVRWGLAVVALLALLASCNGGRDEERRATLDLPRAAQVDAALCAADPAPLGPVQHRLVEGRCLRVLDLFGTDARTPRLRALATTAADAAFVTELFDWAERNYAQYFPGHREDLQLGPYTYRYYPETRNHLAVSGDEIYIQGPVSGGPLVFVARTSDFLCRVRPGACGGEPGCAPISQWTVGNVLCTANPGQSPRIAEGALYSFIDSVGPTTGVATFRCQGGELTAASPATCAVTEVGCDTSAVRWTVDGNECTPNANEPRSIASGNSYTFTDSVRTTGRATFSCTNGALSGPANATCVAPPPIDCTQPPALSWLFNDNVCFADPGTVTVADGALYQFVDSDGVPNGAANFRCVAGTLLPEGDRVCAPFARLRDSFGGDGGPGDAGDSGADGTAADGAPIVGGLVRIVDRNGRTAQATTDSRGYWRTKVTGMVPPFVLSVTRPDGHVRRSLNVQPLKVNGYLFVAITGLTDKLASDLAQAAGFPSAAALTPTMLVNLGPTAVAEKVNALRNLSLVRTQLVAAGLNPDTFDPLNTPFRPDGTGYDQVLDRLVITTDASGATVIREPDCRYSTNSSWTVSGQTCSASSPTPSVLTAPPGGIVTFNDNQGRGSASYRCTGGQLVGVSATCAPLVTSTCSYSPTRSWTVTLSLTTALISYTCNSVGITAVLQAAEGETVTFTDRESPNTGTNSYVCRSGQLVEVSRTCGP